MIIYPRGIILVCFAFFCGMFYKHDPTQLFLQQVQDLALEPESEDVELDPMEKTIKRIKGILKWCGDLCDTTKKITPGEFMGSVTAKVDCKKLFQQEDLYLPADMPPQQWGMIPPELQDMYTYGGRVEMQEWFWSEASIGEGRNEATVFTEEIVQNYIDAFVAGTPMDTYTPSCSNIVAAAADYVDVTDKTILVMGTQDPWLEAVLLSKKPKKVVTLEYGYFISEYPGLTFIRPREFRERYVNGTLDEFDAIFTYSSVEHSGQGRYGDALNPWGDILAVAEAWCVSKKDAVLAMGVASGVGKGMDINRFNADKTYGPLTYPFLATNWKFDWPTKDEDRVDKPPVADPATYQPVYVFKKA